MKSKWIPKCIKNTPCLRHKEGHYYHYACGEAYQYVIGTRPHTIEQRKKISETNKRLGIKPPLRTGCEPWNKGKSWNSEAKEKMRISHLGKGVPWTEERKLKSRGENAVNWRGGLTSLAMIIRGSCPNKLWRKAVFERDNYTCQECGIIGCYLEAHHIKQFAEILREYKITSLGEALNCKELWDTNNGTTLCRKCHDKTKTGMLKKLYVTN